MQCSTSCAEIPPDAGEIKYIMNLPGKPVTFLICAQKEKIQE